MGFEAGGDALDMDGFYRYENVGPLLLSLKPSEALRSKMTKKE